MKKLILTCSALLSLTALAQAQHVRIGVKGGLNASSASVEANGMTNVANKFGFGAYAGGLAEFSLKKKSDKFKLQLEANYNLTNIKHSYTISGVENSAKTMLHSINIPLLAKYFFVPRFSMYLGPTANINLANNYKMNDVNYTDITDLKPFQLGGMIGANYYLIKGLFIEARYHAVIPDVYSTGGLAPEYGPIHNFQIGVGFKF